MNEFLKRISSRKFLTAVAVQIASIVALFAPGRANEFTDTAVRIAALLTMVLASLGYGKIEALLDQQNQTTGEAQKSADETKEC